MTQLTQCKSKATNLCAVTLIAGADDVMMIQVLSVTLTSQADNPLPRVVLNKELYRKAVTAGLTNQPGADMEDRQYQLDITGKDRSRLSEVLSGKCSPSYSTSVLG